MLASVAENSQLLQALVLLKRLLLTGTSALTLVSPQLER